MDAVQRLLFADAPMVVIWEVTRACALACRHCRATAQPHRHPDELTTDAGKRLLDDIRAFGERPPILVLTGGDPLMRPDLPELAAYATAIGLPTSLAPSATVRLQPSLLQELRQAGIIRIAVSLDGDEASHDAFRGVTGSYQRTMRAIEDIHEAGCSLQIGTTVHADNLEQLPAIAEYVNTTECVLWNVFFLIPTGRGRADEMIAPAEHERVFHWLEDLRPTVKFDIKTTAAQHYRRVMYQRALAGRDPALGGAADGLPRYVGVNDGRGFCFISHVGEVNPSGFLPLDAGNVRERSVVEIYRESEVFRALRDPDRLKGKCGRCEFRYLCGGSRARAYAVTGDPLEWERYCIYQPQGGEVILPASGGHRMTGKTTH